MTRRFIQQQPESSPRVTVSKQAQVSLEIALAAVFGVQQNAMPRSMVQRAEQSSFWVLTPGSRNDGLDAAQGPTRSQRRKQVVDTRARATNRERFGRRHPF